MVGNKDPTCHKMQPKNKKQSCRWYGYQSQESNQQNLKELKITVGSYAKRCFKCFPYIYISDPHNHPRGRQEHHSLFPHRKLRHRQVK